jgi:hypothetical protein
LARDPGVDRLLVIYDDACPVPGAAADSWAPVLGAVRDAGTASAVPVAVASTLPELLGDDVAARLIRAGLPAMCGAATHPGGNVIALKGRNAAMAVLADAAQLALQPSVEAT